MRYRVLRSLKRQIHCSNLPADLSGPDDFDTSILSSNMKTPFSEICRGFILVH